MRGICNKPQVKCGECPNQAFLAVSDEVIAAHLRGVDPAHPRGSEFVAGAYPLSADETCWFMAADFDGENWSADALAYLETCHLKEVPAVAAKRGNGYKALGYVLES